MLQQETPESGCQQYPGFLVRWLDTQPTAKDPDMIMLWAAAVLGFSGFFWARELTLPSQKDFQPRKHLCWWDETVDNTQAPNVLRVHLKHSKTNQPGQGVEVYVGKTGCKLCPVAAVSAYMVSRGNQAALSSSSRMVLASHNWLGRHYLQLVCLSRILLTTVFVLGRQHEQGLNTPQLGC